MAGGGEAACQVASSSSSYKQENEIKKGASAVMLPTLTQLSIHRFACIPELSAGVQEEPGAPKRETYEVTTEVKAGGSRQRGSRADALLSASKEAFPDENVSVKPVSQVRKKASEVSDTATCSVSGLTQMEALVAN